MTATDEDSDCRESRVKRCASQNVPDSEIPPPCPDAVGATTNSFGAVKYTTPPAMTAREPDEATTVATFASVIALFAWS